MNPANHGLHSETAMPPRGKEPMSRGEWFALAGLFLAVAQGVYLLGFELQRVNDIERRVVTVEAIQYARGAQMQQLSVDMARIDANMASLAEWAKEQREAERI